MLLVIISIRRLSIHYVAICNMFTFYAWIIRIKIYKNIRIIIDPSRLARKLYIIYYNRTSVRHILLLTVEYIILMLFIFVEKYDFVPSFDAVLAYMAYQSLIFISRFLPVICHLKRNQNEYTFWMYIPSLYYIVCVIYEYLYYQLLYIHITTPVIPHNLSLHSDLSHTHLFFLHLLSNILNHYPFCWPHLHYVISCYTKFWTTFKVIHHRISFTLINSYIIFRHRRWSPLFKRLRLSFDSSELSPTNVICIHHVYDVYYMYIISHLYVFCYLINH